MCTAILSQATLHLVHGIRVDLHLNVLGHPVPMCACIDCIWEFIAESQLLQVQAMLGCAKGVGPQMII